ncbi:MAG: porin, partial [bacterium]|nr:porin [bacterium]
MRKYVGLAGLLLGLVLYPYQGAEANELEQLKVENKRLSEKVEKLSKSVEELMRLVRGKERSSSSGNASSPLSAPQKATPASSSTPSKTVHSGNDKVKLEISGQINRGGLYVDDGTEAELFHVDNDNSSTRVRFVGKAQLDKNLSAGGLFEVQFESNSSASVEIDQTGEAGPNNFTERHATVYLDHKMFGRLWLGQGDTASNGTSQSDLSGTSVINYSAIQDMAGGISFRDRVTKAKVATIKQVYDDFDGLSRRDRARYDSPKLWGLQFSTSHAQGDAWDVALRYGAEYPAIDTKVQAAF